MLLCVVAVLSGADSSRGTYYFVAAVETLPVPVLCCAATLLPVAVLCCAAALPVAVLSWAAALPVVL